MLRYALLLVVFLPVLAWAEDAERRIVVSATGVADAAPDMATVRVGVSREALTAAEAMTAMSEGAGTVLEDLTSLGIEQRDMQTASVSLNPVWEQGNVRPPRIRGYAASTTVSVRVRDLDQLGVLLDRVVSGGANELNGLSFGIADPGPLESAARADAVERATAKAATLAKAAGVGLGAVQSISEGGAQRAPAPMMRGAMMEASAVPIAAGELTVRITVSMTFEISD
ncbi:MAG: SIMPL domain-containing protein [Paracoccaceae bacterium]